MQEKRHRIILLIIFLVFGIVVSLQVRSTLATNVKKTQTSFDAKKLKEELEPLIATQKALQQSISDNEMKKEAFLKLQVEQKINYSLAKLKNELDDTKIKAGLTDVMGKGITIRLNDAAVRTNQNAMDIIIHDSDILKILNILKGSGAAAISINGERIIATSEQICAGPTIRINKNRFPVPYEIKAIGDADLMMSNLNKSVIIILMLEAKIRVEIIKENEIIIPKYNHNLDNLVTALEVSDQ